MAKKQKIVWEPWANIEKVTEGGPGTKMYVDELRRHGIRAMSAHSIYVGQSLLMIERGTRTRAKAILRKAFGNEWFLD